MKDANNRSFWQRMARLYAPFMKSSDRLYQDICLLIRPHLTPGMNVLELACGSGQLSFRLAESVRLWEATDFSDHMIAEAKKKPRPDNLHFSVQDATALPYSPGTFDAVVIANALHVMPHPEQALTEIKRVLKPGGMLFSPTFVHGEGTGFRFRVRLMELVGFHTYFQWDTEEFAAFVASYGFTVTKQQTLGSNLTPLCCLVSVSNSNIQES